MCTQSIRVNSRPLKDIWGSCHQTARSAGVSSLSCRRSRAVVVRETSPLSALTSRLHVMSGTGDAQLNLWRRHYRGGREAERRDVTDTWCGAEDARVSGNWISSGEKQWRADKQPQPYDITVMSSSITMFHWRPDLPWSRVTAASRQMK